MQISSNHSGINFKSVYESVVTRHTQQMPEQNAVTAAAREVESQQQNDSETESTLRETQLLQAAQRSAERTANQLSFTPDL